VVRADAGLLLGQQSIVPLSEQFEEPSPRSEIDEAK
jgi:hypothetical protein